MVARRRPLKKPEDADIDYGATADAFAATLAEKAETAEEHESASEDDQGDPDNENVEGSDDEDVGSGAEKGDQEDIKSDDGEGGKVSLSEDEDDNEDESSSGPGEEVQQAEEIARTYVPHSANGEQCTFDLRNLLAINSHQIDVSSLYVPRANESTLEDNITIPFGKLDAIVNEEYLLEKASDGCAQLIAALWQLPVERSDVGPLVTLPSFDVSKIPRALPPPPPKKETKWEKFAKERGIALNKDKRSRKVWDEATGTWMFRHGFQKANNDSKEWPIMEVKANEDPFADPWERQREAKQERKMKNTESRMRNEERAGNLVKGTTTRMLKSKEKIRQAGKTGGNLDRDMTPPAGVPVDLRPTKVSGDLTPAKRGKVSTVAALKATQRSTASLGKFDKMLEGEPERKKIVAGTKKRKFDSNTGKDVVATEAERSMKLFKVAVEGGGAQKEKARRKGTLAKGETAYDYDFDDGLGPNTFRKKKGRAGAGKMRKMTKKRVK